MPENFEQAFMVIKRDDLFWLVGLFITSGATFVFSLFNKLGWLVRGHDELSSRQQFIADTIADTKQIQQESTRATKSMARLIHWDATQRARSSGLVPPPPLDLD